jgi:hypothetical protein
VCRKPLQDAGCFALGKIYHSQCLKYCKNCPFTIFETECKFYLDHCSSSVDLRRRFYALTASVLYPDPVGSGIHNSIRNILSWWIRIQPFLNKKDKKIIQLKADQFIFDY